MVILSFSLYRGPTQLCCSVTAADLAACKTAARAYAQAFANLTPGKKTQLHYAEDPATTDPPTTQFLGVKIETFTPAATFTITEAVFSGVTVVTAQ